MKRVYLILSLMLTVIIALTSCMACVKHQDINKDGKCDVCFTAITEDPDGGEEGGEDPGNGPTAPTSFSIQADKSAVYSGSTVMLSVSDGAALGSYTAADVEFTATSSSDSVSASINGSSLALNGVGTVKITAKIGGVASGNELTVAVLPSNSLVSSNISAAVAVDNAFIGARHDIGITSDIASYYKVDGENDYVRINEDGTLEIIGARAKNSILKITALDGDVVFEGFYNVSGSNFVFAVRQSLLNEGDILSASADIPASKLAELESLSLIDGKPLINPYELCGFKYLTSLKSLSLAKNDLGNLSFIKGLTTVESLDISYAGGLDTSDGGIAVINNIKSLTSLKEISIHGSLSYVNRQIYDTLHTMVANGQITLEVLEGVKLSAANIDSFSETVFFSIAECKAHTEQRGGSIIPSGEWTHAIISIPATDYDKYFKVYADNLAVLELYGSDKGYSNAIQVYSVNSLDLNLYNFAMSAPRRDYGIGIHIDNSSATETTLKINAKRGYNYIKGADWYPGSFPNPGEAIVCDNLEVYSENGASLNVIGGLGYIGAAGGWSSGPLQGGRGGDGADAIVCNEAWFYTYSLYIKGGNGGAGGKGCDGGGELYESVLGYFNGAKGGTGGTGGYALYCANFHTLDLETDRSFINECLFGGDAGIGGQGGNGKMAGSDGEQGDLGIKGKRYLGETGRPTGPIH